MAQVVEDSIALERRTWGSDDLLIEDAQALTAAGEPHTGAMIALVPSDADVARLVVDGGEEADQLHLTLLYLGEAALIPSELREALVDDLAAWAGELGTTVIGKVFAVNMFNPPDLTAGATEPCVVLGVSGDQLDAIHSQVDARVQDRFSRAGVLLHEQHRPWIPHITLVYTDDADLSYFTDRIGPVTFDRVRLAFGDDVYDVPLGESSSNGDELTAAFDPNQLRDSDGKWTDNSSSGGDNTVVDELWNSLGRRDNGDVLLTSRASSRSRYRLTKASDDNGDFIQIGVHRAQDGTWNDSWGTIRDSNKLRDTLAKSFFNWDVSDTSSSIPTTEQATPSQKVKSPAAREVQKQTLPLTQVTSDMTKPDVQSSDFPRVTHAQAAKDFKRSWTPKQRATVSTYTDKYYEDVNNYLRGVSTPEGADRKFLDQQVTALTNLMKPSPQPMTLLRGTRAVELGVGSNDELHTLVGKTGIARGFSSTSLDRAFGKYSDGVLLHVQAPTGTRMMYVDPVSDSPGEHEMILPPGIKYKVVEVREPDPGLQQWQVVVRIVP